MTENSSQIVSGILRGTKSLHPRSGYTVLLYIQYLYSRIRKEKSLSKIAFLFPPPVPS